MVSGFNFVRFVSILAFATAASTCSIPASPGCLQLGNLTQLSLWVLLLETYDDNRLDLLHIL